MAIWLSSQHTPPQGTCRYPAFLVYLAGTRSPGTCQGPRICRVPVVGACRASLSTRHSPGTFPTGTRQLPLLDKHPPGTYFPGTRPAQFKSGAFWVPLIRRLFSIFGCLGIFDTGRAPPLCGAGSVPSVLGYRFGAISTGAGHAPLPLGQNAIIYSVSILPPSSRLFVSWYTVIMIYPASR